MSPQYNAKGAPPLKNSPPLTRNAGGYVDNRWLSTGENAPPDVYLKLALPHGFMHNPYSFAGGEKEAFLPRYVPFCVIWYIGVATEDLWQHRDRN
jgi:hypothetical protein